MNHKNLCVVYCTMFQLLCVLLGNWNAIGIACFKVILLHSFHSNDNTPDDVQLNLDDLLDERSIDLRKHITRPDLEGSQVQVSLSARNSIGSSEFSNTVRYTVPSSSTTGTLAVCKAVFKIIIR